MMKFSLCDAILMNGMGTVNVTKVEFQVLVGHFHLKSICLFHLKSFLLYPVVGKWRCLRAVRESSQKQTVDSNVPGLA